MNAEHLVKFIRMRGALHWLNFTSREQVDIKKSGWTLKIEKFQEKW